MLSGINDETQQGLSGSTFYFLFEIHFARESMSISFLTGNTVMTYKGRDNRPFPSSLVPLF